MTCRELTTTPFPASPALGSRLAAWTSALWQSYVDRRTQRATVRILESLDARTLKDIGISPGEIQSVVYGRNDRRRYYR
jgi:uncharacterized protein YjiS (DUF1127 family)